MDTSGRAFGGKHDAKHGISLHAHQDECDRKRQHAAGMLDALVAHDGEGKRNLKELHSDDISDQQACYEEPACKDRGRSENAPARNVRFSNPPIATLEDDLFSVQCDMGWCASM